MDKTGFLFEYLLYYFVLAFFRKCGFSKSVIILKVFANGNKECLLNLIYNYVSSS